MGIIDSILQLQQQGKLRGQLANQGIPPALQATINDAGNNATVPAPPDMQPGSVDAGAASGGIPAVLKSAIATPPAPPQLTPRTGFFDGATPPAGQPYQPAGMMDKISRVAGLVGGVAKAVAPYAGEGARQLQASQFNDQQALAQAREARAGQEQQFEQGIQGQQEGRAEQAFPLTQQAEQQKIANTRSPEQLAEINSNEVEATPLGQFFKVNKFRGTAAPVTMEDTPGTPLQTTPKSTRYSVEMDKQDRPVAVVDQFTKQRYMGNDPNLPPEARQLMEGYAQSHAAAIKEKYDNEDRLNAHSDARQIRGFQHQFDIMNAKHDLGANELTAHAQDQLGQNTGRLNSIEQTMQALEPIKNQNDMGHFLVNKLGYAFGREPQYEGVGKNVADLMAQLNLQQIQGGAAVLKGASRGFQALSEAMKHMPDPIKDSPQLMYNKLQNVRDMINISNYAQVAYGMKRQGPPNPNAPAVNYTDVAKAAQVQGISVADAARQAIGEGYQLLDSGYPGAPGKQGGK